MAIAVRSHAQASGSIWGELGITVAKPAGTVEGDLLVAFVGWYDVHGAPWASTGWTEAGSWSSGTGNDRMMSVLYRVAGSSEPASWTFTCVHPEAYYDTCAVIVTLSGVDRGTPLDVAATGNPNVADDASPANVSITTATDNALVLVAALVTTSITAPKTSFSAPASCTTQAWVQYPTTGTVFHAVLGVGYAARPTAGLFDPGSWQTLPDDSTAESITVAVALRELSVQTVTQDATLADPDTVLEPTVVPGTRTITAPLISGAGTIPTPTVGLEVTPGVVTGAETLHQPTVTVGGTTVSPATLVRPATVRTPKVNLKVTLPVIASGGQVRAPLVTPATIENVIVDGARIRVAYTVTSATVIAPSVIADPDTVITPTVTAGGVSITQDSTLADPDSVLAPQVDLGLTAPALAAPSTLYPPNVNPESGTVITVEGVRLRMSYTASTPRTVTVPVLADPDTVLQPSISGVIQYVYPPTYYSDSLVPQPATLDAPDTVYEPTVIPDQLITPGVLTDPDSVLEPVGVEVGGIALQLEDEDVIHDPDTVQEPTVTPGGVTVSPGVLARPATLRGPVILTTAPDQVVSTPALDDPDTPLAPVVKIDQTVTVPLLTDADTPRAPVVGVDTDQTLSVAELDEPDSVLAPTVANNQNVTVPVLSDPDTVIAPVVTTVASGKAVSPPTVTAADTVLEPAMQWDVVVTAGALADADTVLEPAVQPGTATASPDVLADPDTVLAPVLTTDYTITVSSTIATATVIHVPALTYRNVVVLDTLNAPATVSAPSVARNLTGSGHSGWGIPIGLPVN